MRFLLGLLALCACLFALAGPVEASGRGAALAVECAPARFVAPARSYYAPAPAVILPARASFRALAVDDCYGGAPAAFSGSYGYSYQQQFLLPERASFSGYAAPAVIGYQPQTVIINQREGVVSRVLRNLLR